MNTPATLALGGVGSQGAPGTGGRRSTAGLTPRTDLGFYGYLGFGQHPPSGNRRTSLALSVRNVTTGVFMTPKYFLIQPALHGSYLHAALLLMDSTLRNHFAQDSALMSEDLDGDAEATYIWGTNLTVARVMSRFNAFIRGFTETAGEEPKYLRLLAETRARGEVSFNIDGGHIYAFDPTLYQWTISFPVETVPIYDYQLALITCEMEGVTDPDSLDRPLQTRVFNLRRTRVIRDLDPSDIGTLVSIGGMVTRTSGVIPDQSLACFRCTRCGHESITRNDRGNIDEPSKCPNPGCGLRFTMQLVYNCSAFVDKQLVKVQEAPNDIPEGETPHTVTMFTRQDLVDAAKPGDRVTVVGIYRAQPVRVNPRGREVKSVYKTFIDVMHIEKDGNSEALFSLLADETQSGMEAEAATPRAGDAVNPSNPEFAPTADPAAGLLNASNMTSEEVDAKREQFKALAADPDVYERLAASLAPSIWQLEDVKKGLLCQLFGGVSKPIAAGKTRGEINVLLVGDPGVSKSQILSYVHKLAPRGIYTSGRGSSAVGLTAYVTRDPETREMVLESGALVLSDRGVCCIDEFDKMSEAARSVLHEVMEQQTISVAKAGIIATLNARTSVLACANPVGSRYNPNMSVVENIQLPPSLMSRFDLIYLLLDKADEVTDRRLARHLISLFGDPSTLGNAAAAPVPADVLREYIAYARATCNPKLTPESAQKLANAYTDMRALGMSRKTVSATPRQLESLIRLSEGLARMRLAPYVEESDVDEAVRLMQVAMQQSSIDPRTGQIDMDIIQTGVSAADRSARAQLAGQLREALEARAGGASGSVGGGVRIADLVEQLAQTTGANVSEADVQRALVELQGQVRVDQGRVTLLGQ